MYPFYSIAGVFFSSSIVLCVKRGKKISISHLYDADANPSQIYTRSIEIPAEKFYEDLFTFSLKTIYFEEVESTEFFTYELQRAT